MDGLQSEFTDLVAREGALNLLLAHVDGAVTAVVRLAHGSHVLGRGVLEIVIRTIGAQPVAGGRCLCGRILQNVGEDAVGRARNAHPRVLVVGGDRVSEPGQRARDAGGQQGLSVDLVDRLGERRIHQRGAHDCQELGALLLGDVARSHLGLDDADESGQGQALDNEGTRRDEQGDRQQQRAHRGVRRDRLRRGQGDRTAHARPDDDAALARAQRFVLEVIQVGSAHGVAARAALEAATIVVERIFPAFGTQVARLKHVGIDLTGSVHALFEALKVQSFGVVAALAMGAAVVQPGEHERDEHGSDDHDERAEGDREEGGEGQAAGERGGLLDNAEGLQAHRQEDPALQDERHGLPVLLGESPVRRGDHGGASARDNQAGDDGCDQAGASQVLGGD